MVVRTVLLLALAATTAACTNGGPEALLDAAIGKTEERSEKDVRVDLQIVRVLDQSPELDRLTAFIRTDEQAASHGVGVVMERRGRGQVEVMVVEGTVRAGLASYFGGLLEREPSLALPPEQTLAFGPNQRKQPGGSSPRLRAYVLDNPTTIRVTHLRSAAVEEDPQLGLPHVKLELGEDESAKFEALTAASIDSAIAIVKRGEVVSAPIVREKIGGGVLIVSFAVDRAKTEAAAFYDDIFGNQP